MQNNIRKRIALETLTCPSCVKKLEQGINKLNGVENTEVRFTTSTLRVSYNPEEISLNDIETRIGDLGFAIK